MADERTFSQEEVNGIVQRRLAEEREKLGATRSAMEADLAKRESDLARKEFEFSARATLAQKGLPVELLEALNTSSPESFNKSLELLESHMAAYGDKVKEQAQDGPRITIHAPSDERATAIREAMADGIQPAIVASTQSQFHPSMNAIREAMGLK